MKKNRIFISILVFLLLAVLAVPTFAQGGNPPRQTQFRDQALLEALDITADELHDRLIAGETIEELYAQAGLEMPTFRDSIVARGRASLINLADALDITVEELEARLDAGEPIQDLYAEAGLEIPAAFSEMDQLLSALDITAAELRDLLQNGTSIQELYQQADLEMPTLFQNHPYAELADALDISLEELQDRIQSFYQELYDQAGLEMPENFLPAQGGAPMNNRSPINQGPPQGNAPMPAGPGHANNNQAPAK